MLSKAQSAPSQVQSTVQPSPTLPADVGPALPGAGLSEYGSSQSTAKPSWRWRAFSYLRLAAVTYLLLLLVMMLFENRLVFVPTRYPGGMWNNVPFEYEDAWFTTSDGVKLHGWFVPCENARAVALFCHGNAGNLSHRQHALQLLQAHGVTTLIFDYRGYGRSEGSPNETGVLLDARAARQWLCKRTGLEPNKIVVMGESIGGAVAVDLAADCGARGLVLESTFSTLPDAASVHYPWLPVRYLMRTKLDSVSKIGNYHGPLLQVHGDADRIVPFALGQRLFAAANEPKQFLVIAGGDHNDPRTPEFQSALDSFLGGLAK